MSETSEMNESTGSTKNTGDAEMKKIIAYVGYCGETDERRPKRFSGIKVAIESNESHQGENQTRYHDWILYQVKGGYRVLDCYKTQWQGESNHNTLSDVLTPQEVAEEYPAIANEYFSAEDIAEDLD